MPTDPQPHHGRTPRAWREAPTGREAWTRFRNWLARARPQDDGDAPWWAAQDYFELRFLSGPGSERLVLFQKMNDFLSNGRGWHWATRRRIAMATAPFAPRAHEVALIRAHARLLGAGGPIGLFGDLDPHGLHTLGALRSGNLDAPSLDGRKLKVEWLGIDDAWLRRARRGGRPLRGRLIRMGWVEREYWGVVQRMMPGVRALIGEESFQLLESGVKAECEGFREIMVPMLRLRTAGWLRSAR